MNPLEDLFLALSNADDVVSRLDELLRFYAGRSGLVSRLDYDEASAWAWNNGFSATTEDLLLHAEAMDLRMPTQDLRAAYSFVLARRRAESAGPELLSLEGAKWLMAVRKNPPAAMADLPKAPSPAPVLEGVDVVGTIEARLRALETTSTSTHDADFQEWLSILLAPRGRRPVLLHAAFALETWSMIDPYPRATYLGGLLVGVWLRSVKRVASHLLSIERGLRVYRRRHPRRLDLAPMQRVTERLRMIAEAATATHAEYYRLELRRQGMARYAVGRRAHSRLGDAIKLICDFPIVTTPMMSRSLKISQTSATRLLTTLRPHLTEITGNARFRAWRA